MGGGGAIRAAAKIAGINAGFRGVENPISAAAARRAAAKPVEEVNWSGLSVSQSNNPIDAAAQRPCWELDDWEFAGGEGDSFVNSGEPLPRLVFGGAPTLEEAKEATNELKNTLDKIYLSPSSPTESKEADESVLSLIPKQEHMETKAFVVSEATTKSLPTNALKAFRLLNESSAAQSVVASIASDPNVWQAVLQNEALTGFLQSQKSAAPMSDISVTEISDTTPAHRISKSSYEAYDSGELSDSKNWFVEFLEGLKNSVSEKMNDLSDYFQNLFGGPPSAKANEETDASAGATTFTDKAMGASFMGLAIMVIMMIVLKRPQ